MSLLDKQKVQDIWSGFICKRASEDTTLSRYSYRSTEKRRRRKNAKSRMFFFARCVRKIALYSNVMHSFDWKSAVEHDGGI